MGILTCSRCKATTEADSIEEGRHRLDHSIGLTRANLVRMAKLSYSLQENKKLPKKHHQQQLNLKAKSKIRLVTQ